MQPPLRILLDSASLKSAAALRLLEYEDNECFELVSIGASQKHTQLDIVPDIESRISQLNIDKLHKFPVYIKSSRGFRWRMEDITMIANETGIAFKDIILLFIMNELADNKDITHILVTERKKLLNPVNLRLPGIPSLPAFTIFSPAEANLFIDVHCKKLGTYMIAPNFYCNKGLWYLYSLKTKADIYQLLWSYVVLDKTKHDPALADHTGSLGDRLTDMLVAIDEIGKSYYAGPSNDNEDTIIYHFNYWITLFTGVLDNVAWIAQEHYRIKIDQNQQIGLRASRHGTFLKELYHHNSKFKDLLTENANLIELLYGPRDLIIHRNTLKGITINDVNENYTYNMVKISKDFFDRINQFTGKSDKNLGAWGHMQMIDSYCLEPYRLVRMATPKLIDFVNAYLQLFNVQREPMPANTKNLKGLDFESQLRRFKEHALGF